jgi:hypothetical protein
MRVSRPTLFAVLLLASSITAQVRVVPIADGWAKNQINAVIFRKNSVTSFNGFQYAAFYDPTSRVNIAKRKLGSKDWEIKVTPFTGNTADAHNSISLAVDGNAVLHLSWNNHNTPLKYARGAQPGSLELKEAPMVGKRELRATYPEFYNMPNGDLIFLYRDGASGSGNIVLNRYDVKSGSWERVQDNVIDGENKRNAYPQTAIDAKGTIHISWVWRESPDVASNHDIGYARSNDSGKTWERSNGEKYQIPINATTAEYIARVPQNSGLINQTSMAADRDGNAYIATYWRDQNSTVPQYRLIYFNGSSWRVSQVSNRMTAFALSGGGTKQIPMSRPQVLADSRGKVIILFRDIERGSRASAAICDKIAQCKWTVRDLGDASLGMWEPTFDQALWNRKHELHLFVQNVGQGDGEKIEDIAPQQISILEWNPGGLIGGSAASKFGDGYACKIRTFNFRIDAAIRVVRAGTSCPPVAPIRFQLGDDPGLWQSIELRIRAGNEGKLRRSTHQERRDIRCVL